MPLWLTNNVVALDTETFAVATDEICDTPIDVCSWLGLTKVVGIHVPFQLTTSPMAKPVPFTVRVNAAPPATAVGGSRLVMEGPGLPCASEVTRRATSPRSNR